MSKYKMYAGALPNIPWQDKPEGKRNSPLWRYSENPIIHRNPVEGVARIFNSAVMDTARMPYTGSSSLKRSVSLTKTAIRSCRFTHTIRGW